MIRYDMKFPFVSYHTDFVRTFSIPFRDVMCTMKVDVKVTVNHVRFDVYYGIKTWFRMTK